MNVDAARDAWIDKARAVRIEAEIARRSSIKLKREGAAERVGPCPLCKGTDRFSINTKKQVFNCRGCGKGGDVIEFVRHVDKVDFDKACEMLTGEPPPPRKANGHDADGTKQSQQSGGKKELAETYDYVDADGTLLFQVLRMVYRLPDGSLELTENGKPKKTFSQRRPADEPKLWVWTINKGEVLRRGPGCDWYGFKDENWDKLPAATRQRKTIAAAKVTPYRLPGVVEAIEGERTVFIVEGEQKADRLAEWNIAATCNAQGAEKWKPEHAVYLRGADIVIIGDNNEPGRRHVETVAQSLAGIATRIRIVELSGLEPDQDVVDWIAAGGTREELDELVGQAGDWKPQQAAAADLEVVPGGAPEFELRPDKVPKATCANARLAIRALGITCRYDRFHDKLLVGGHPIAQHVGELSDHACLVVRRIVTERFKFDPGRNHTFDASVQLCLESSFDPILDYLDSLKWDGEKRLDTWMQTYLGAKKTDLNQAISRLALLAMARRVRQPGCKFDQIIVFEGPEGTEKSKALSVLAGGPENFSDQTILGQSDQQQQERLRGKWVYEIADLSGIRKAEVEQVKAFASRTHDRARPAYGRSLVELPRRCVIFATTNEDTYLKSQTGNRRFWPVKTGTINTEALRRDRDQLLAEAAVLEATGASLELPRELWGTARAVQDQRMEHDPWLDKLASLTGTFHKRRDGHAGNEERITSDEILSLNLGISAERQTDATTKRLAYVMRKLGWDGPTKLRFGVEEEKAPPRRGYWRLPPPYPKE